MANTVEAVVTDIWREKLARIYANDDATLGAFSVPSEFRIGEGGFQIVGSNKEPKAPDATRTDLEAPSLAVGDDYVFTKALIEDGRRHMVMYAGLPIVGRLLDQLG